MFAENSLIFFFSLSLCVIDVAQRMPRCPQTDPKHTYVISKVY